MVSRAGLLAVALALAFTTTAIAQPSTASFDQRGKVLKIDEPQGVVVLDDGRMYRVRPDTVLFVDNQPVRIGALAPGSAVVIRSADPVMLQDGRYIVMTSPSTTVVTSSPSASPATVVTTTTPGALAVKQTLHGQVKDVDRNGQITVKTVKGEFDVRVTPEAARGIRAGDTVTIDVTFSPPGTTTVPSTR